ncbi:MAG TPA: ROK family transcriptional regulator [Anaerolineales bacterium]|nr:ROK family transcriptional regulator [Anaerolineales bacterium]
MPQQFRTGDQSLVRHLNRSILLQRLWVGSPVSRADLAAGTGLNKTTVSNLVEELISDGFVREVGRNPSLGGRPGVLLELDPDAGWIIGCEIGVGHLSVALANLRAQVTWRRQAAFSKDDSVQVVLDRLASLMRQAAKEAQATGRRLHGAGVAVPGLVDISSGSLVFEPNMGWRSVALRTELAGRLDLPVIVDNDGNAAALAERYFGVAQGVDDFAYVVANIGLGAGLVIGGHIHYGISGYAGEAGHTTIDPDGPLCRCGNRGCWERLASQRALIERIEQASWAGPPPVPDEADWSRATSAVRLERILQAAGEGDPVVREALRQTGTYLGIGIANLVNLLNPSLVAFGGSLSLAHEYLLPVAREVVQQRAMAELRQTTRVVVSSFRQDACVIGGVALVVHDLLSRPRLVPAGTIVPAEAATERGRHPELPVVS